MCRGAEDLCTYAPAHPLVRACALPCRHTWLAFLNFVSWEGNGSFALLVCWDTTIIPAPPQMAWAMGNTRDSASSPGGGGGGGGCLWRITRVVVANLQCFSECSTLKGLLKRDIWCLGHTAVPLRAAALESGTQGRTRPEPLST